MGEEDNEIPDSGAVFTFGRSRFAENLPSHFFIRNDPVVDISCGDEHTLVVCQNGRVFGFGGNEFGQLGLGTTSAVTKPSCIKSLKPEKVKRIVCGKTHSLALTGTGKLFAWGNNSDCQLGTGNEDNSTTPKQVELNEVKESISYITAGDQHSALLTDGGKVYIWGSNSCGQLGLSDGIKNCSKPTPLSVKEKVLQIACGYLHTIMLTEDKYLLVFGDGTSGKLGLGGTSSVPIPIPLKFDKNVRSIAAGGNHSLALTDEGDVYAWGNNEHGQLGFSAEKTEITNPILVTPLLNVRVAQIACGDGHSAFISDNGELYTCGESKYGKLCSDSELKSDIMGSRTLPFKVNRFKALKVQKVACGGCQTMVLALPSNRQKQITVNGCIDKTNKENDLAKKAISETSIEGLSEISSTPRKTSRTSLPPLQKVVIPKKEPDSESLSAIPNLKSNDEEKLNGNDNHHENGTAEENSQENFADTTNMTEPLKDEYIINEEIPDNVETVSNDGSNASDGKESREKDSRKEPAGMETATTTDNVSMKFPSNNVSFVQRIHRHRQTSPMRLKIGIESRNRKSTAFSLENEEFYEQVLSENQHEFSTSLPCLNVDVSCEFKEKHDAFSMLTTKENEMTKLMDDGIPKCLTSSDLTTTDSEKSGSMVVENQVADYSKVLDFFEVDVREDGKLFSKPRDNTQCLLAFKLNENTENVDEVHQVDTCRNHSKKGYKLMQNILYNCWTRCNLDKIKVSLEEENWSKDLENIKLEGFFNGEDNENEDICIGEKKLREIIGVASRNVENFSQEITHDQGNDSGDTTDKSKEGSSIESVYCKFEKEVESCTQHKDGQNYDFVCVHEKNFEIEKEYQNNEDNGDYFTETNTSIRSSEFEYVNNRKLLSSMSCPDSPLKFDENNLKRDENRLLNRSGSSSMSYLSQTNNLRRKIFVENEYARSTFSMDSIINIDETEEDEFDLLINCQKFESMNNHCVKKDEDVLSLGSKKFNFTSTVKNVSEDGFSEDSLISRNNLEPCSRTTHQCRLCGTVIQGKIDGNESENNPNSRKSTNSILSNIRTNLRSIVQRTKTFTSNYYKDNMISKAISRNGCFGQVKDRSEIFANEAYDDEITVHWMKDQIVEESDEVLENFKNSPLSKLDENWGECCLKLIFKGDKVPVMVSEDTGSAADMSSTISVVSPASERKAETNESTKSQPVDENQIQEDTKPHEEKTGTSETPISENKDEAKPENKKETKANVETKNKSPKQKDKNKGTKKPTSSVCVIL